MAQHTTYDEENKIRPVLVLVNPQSGRGNSLKHLKDIVIPTLDSLDISYKIHVTDANMRVQDYLSGSNLSDLTRFKTILIVSGDGLLHHAVNTILKRSDWQHSIRIPLGIIPTGSGNGMAYTLVRQQRPRLKAGRDAIRFCCEQAVKSDTCMSDLIKITYGKGSVVWSFLSLGWGLLSDIDVDSDWLRSLGEWRFTIYGILRAFTANSYRGKLSYKRLVNDETIETGIKDSQSCDMMARSRLDFVDDHQPESNYKDGEENWTHIEGVFACMYAVYQSHISSGTKFAPESTLTDQTIYLTYIKGTLSIVETIKFLLAIEDGTHHKLPFVTVVPVETFTFQPLEPSKIVADGEIIPWTLDDGPLMVTIVPRLMKLSWCQERLPSSVE